MSSQPDLPYQRFCNRELSWIEFNARVLHEALRPDVPLLERLKFLCIVTSNFDEFFMVRVAAVKRQIRAGDHVECPSGIVPSQLLKRICARVREVVQTNYRCLLDDLLPALAQRGLTLKRTNDLSSEQTSFVKKLFYREVFPVLTPVRALVGRELPYVTNLKLHAAFLLEPQGDATFLLPDEREQPADEYLAVVQIPTSLDRLIMLPEESGGVSFALLEDLVVEHAPTLFPGYRITEHCLFRVTRDADMGVDEERDEDFVEALEQVVGRRDLSDAVRLSVSRGAGRLKRVLAAGVGIPEEEVFDRSDPLDIGGFLPLTTLPGFDHLRYDRWQPADSPMLPRDEPLWDAIRRRDVLLHHPFESFDPIARLLEDAASDPAVLAIKMTLYRTGGESRIVRSLEEAAAAGKQVTVLVEIKARFDEERNISWAERLERAGAIVIYGIARLKVHAKAAIIIRREPKGIQRYVHLGTGNYNEGTARLYADLGLLTTNPEIAYETGLFFNAISGYSAIPVLSHLVMAPVSLKGRLIQLIEREALRAADGSPARIWAKLNALGDVDVIEALYRASRAGVEVKLNIRGVCMLLPGLEGLSENIEVVSIIDRYLEHARLFYFHNGGAGEFYASSADWMTRNLERRVELMFPILDEQTRARAMSILATSFRDNARAHRIGPDGTSRALVPGPDEEALESQRTFQERCLEEARRGDPMNRKVFEVRKRPQPERG